MLLTNLALGEICEALHGSVHCAIRNGVAIICVGTVRRSRPYHLSWVQVLDRQLRLVVLFGVLRHVALHKECQVDTVFAILAIVKVARCIRVVLKNLLLFFVNQSAIGTVRHHNDAVALQLGALNDRLVDAILAVELE